MVVPRLLGYTAAATAGLAINAYLLPGLFATGWAVSAKLANRGELCSWRRILTYHPRLEELEELYRKARRELVVREVDAAAGLERIQWTPGRDLWMVRREAEGGRGHAWLLATHDWMERNNLEDHVQPGDVVIDVGARDGVFVARALMRGASKVLAIEPDPRHLECLRRNFHGEIAFGRVVVAPVGAWSEEGTRALDGTGGREAPVTRIDTLVEDLKLARVHFIRIGIEGAEREALQGALGTLRTDRPRVMLELRRRRGDPAGLRRLLRSAHADYQPSCGPCRQGEEREGELLPQVVYFR